MNAHLITTVLSLSLLAPAAPDVVGGLRRAHAPFVATALRAHCDTGLEGLRAGSTQRPALLASGERAALQQAQSRSADLAHLRAAGLTNEQWTWVAVGALVVIVLLLV